MLTHALTHSLLDALFSRKTWTSKPSSFYVGALTTGPTDATGIGAVEVSAVGYARVAVAATSTEWGDNDSGNALANGRSLIYGVKNKNQIAFATALANWGTITHIALYSAATAGQLLAAIPLAVPLPLPPFATLRVAAGAMRITLSGAFLPAAGDALLNYLFRNAVLGVPSSWHLALGNSLSVTLDQNSTPSDTTDDSMTLAFTELTSDGYARVNIPNTAERWPLASGGDKILAGTTLAFPAATADWTSAGQYVLYDASTSGTAWFGGDLQNLMEAVTGDVPQVPASALTFTFPA